ncbi:unnamed protein product [Symbiodinium microadriaticum]|nr:unnamed protein product [Symbiodinium microadriaticum]
MAQSSAALSASTKTLQQLNRRFSRLRALQRRLVLPPITQFTTSGIKFNLPLRTTARACQQLPQHTLEYLAGFFDGDGCVFGDVKQTSMLCVEQCSSGSPVLLLFRSAFGGSISGRGVRTGLQRPVLRWHVSGKRARDAASLLATVASCKRPQLIIAADWPQTFESRAHAAAELKRLKNVAPKSVLCPSWAYFAGFFDAEGCISMRFPSQICLIIVQKLPGILQALRDFLAGERIACQLSTTERGARLVIGATKVSKHVLCMLLSAGLRVKREAARTAVSMHRGSFQTARGDLAHCVGYQNRYKRLTAEGLLRSRSIGSLRSKLGNATDALHPSLQEELQQLRADHAWSCALERCALIRSDVRTMLAQGARQKHFNKGCDAVKAQHQVFLLEEHWLRFEAAQEAMACGYREGDRKLGAELLVKMSELNAKLGENMAALEAEVTRNVQLQMSSFREELQRRSRPGLAEELETKCSSLLKQAEASLGATLAEATEVSRKSFRTARKEHEAFVLKRQKQFHGWVQECQEQLRETRAHCDGLTASALSKVEALQEQEQRRWSGELDCRLGRCEGECQAGRGFVVQRL